MIRLARLIVLCVIATAIPIQGIAAATVMHLCAPSHAVGAASAVSHPSDAHSTHWGIASPVVDDTKHPIGHIEAFGAPDARSDAGGDAAGHAGHGTLKCCSVGFSIAAFFSSTLPTRDRARSPAPLQPVAQIYPAVTLDGLDRPPKLLLA